jgi:hypothetical protein
MGAFVRSRVCSSFIVGKTFSRYISIELTVRFGTEKEIIHGVVTELSAEL